jgi:transcriptional regulator with XRE-family HTH domain
MNTTNEGLTPNQLVAYNLRRARELRGWTQEETAKRLEPYIGVRWSKATFSAAERSVAGDRVRQFDADDLVSLSLVFDLPLTWWFLPPDEDPAAVRLPGPAADASEVARLLDLLLVWMPEPLRGRILNTLAAIPAEQRTTLQVAAYDYASALGQAVLADRTDTLRRYEEQLREASALTAEVAETFALMRRFITQMHVEGYIGEAPTSVAEMVERAQAFAKRSERPPEGQEEPGKAE